MKTVKKKLMLVVMIAAVAICSAFAPCGTGTVQAKSKPYMKKLKVNMDLKKNKEVIFKSRFRAVGMQKMSGKITNFKITNADQAGYKKLTFTCVIKWKWKPTKKQIHSIVKSSKALGGRYFCSILDYNTGSCLNSENEFGVTVTSGDWKYSNRKKYKDKDGCNISYSTTGKLDVAVVYPETYKGLCIGVGGSNTLKSTKGDKQFWDGKQPFGKTSYYKKGKKNSHVMRVTK